MIWVFLCLWVGPPGPPGDTGATGDTGFAGFDGYTGRYGRIGDTGSTGLPGNGPLGLPGKTGPAGFDGYPGVRGDTGMYVVFVWLYFVINRVDLSLSLYTVRLWTIKYTITYWLSDCHNCSVIRPPGTVVPGRPYVLQQFLFFFVFNARSPRSVGRSPRNFATWSEACSIYKCRFKNLGACPPKKTNGRRGDNTLNLARFRTTSHFEREYLRNGQRYLKSENYLTDSVSSRVQRKKFGELWSTNHGDC